MMSATKTWISFSRHKIDCSVNQFICRFKVSSKIWNWTWLNHRKCGSKPHQFWISLVLIHPFGDAIFDRPTAPLVEHQFASNQSSAFAWVRVTLVIASLEAPFWSLKTCENCLILVKFITSESTASTEDATFELLKGFKNPQQVVNTRPSVTGPKLRMKQQICEMWLQLSSFGFMPRIYIYILYYIYIYAIYLSCWNECFKISERSISWFFKGVVRSFSRPLRSFIICAMLTTWGW